MCVCAVLDFYMSVNKKEKTSLIAITLSNRLAFILLADLLQINKATVKCDIGDGDKTKMKIAFLFCFRHDNTQKTDIYEMRPRFQVVFIIRIHKFFVLLV